MIKSIFVLFLLIISTPAYAQNFYSRTPANTGPLQSAIFNVGINQQDFDDQCLAFGATGVGFSITQFDPNFAQISSDEITFSDNIIYTWTFGVADFNAQQVTIDCSFGGTVNPGSFLSLEFDNFNNLFSTSIALPPIIGGNMYGANGLLGDFSPTDLLASVGTGVVDTGAMIWPLFAILGVIIAFIIAGKVRDFIMHAGEVERERRKNKRIDFYAPGSEMASLPNMTKDDKEYYLSDQYPGNKEYYEPEAIERGKKNFPSLWN